MKSTIYSLFLYTTSCPSAGHVALPCRPSDLTSDGSDRFEWIRSETASRSNSIGSGFLRFSCFLLMIRAAKYLPSFYLSSSVHDSARSRRLSFFPLPPSAAPPPLRQSPPVAGCPGHAAALGRWHEATRRRHRPSTDLRGRLFFCPCCGSARHLGLPAARHLFLSVAPAQLSDRIW